MGPLTDFMAPLSFFDGQSINAVLYLTDATAPCTLSSTLESWVVPETLPISGEEDIPQTFVSLNKPILLAGMPCTIYAKASRDTFISWNWNSQGIIGNTVRTSDHVNYSAEFENQAALRVRVASAPEPAALSLLALGSLVLLRRRREKPACKWGLHSLGTTSPKSNV